MDEPRTPLERLLGAALAKTDPVPPGLIEASAALHDLIDAEAALGRLVEAEGAAVRAAAVQQTFSWEPDVELSVQLSRSEGVTALIGYVTGLEPERAVVEQVGADPVEVEVTLGTFEAQIDADRRFRIVLVHPDRRLTTPWQTVEL